MAGREAERYGKAALRAGATALVERESARFAQSHPNSRALSEIAHRNYLGGVPMHWMLDWGTPFPLSIVSAQGATIQDADGFAYADFCLGDGGALFGHSPPAVARAIAGQSQRGLTAMLPGPETATVGQHLARLFGLPFWQFTATASDANRAVIRWARALTARDRILVFDGCYHGQIEEIFVELVDGRTVFRESLIGQVSDSTAHVIMVPFNDTGALEEALSAGDVALVLTEPALTNTAMVLPEAGYLARLFELCRTHGTLVCLDETHTLASSLGGHTGRDRLRPDFFVVGKAVAGGFPSAVFGFTTDVEAGMRRVLAGKPEGYSGIGTTLAGNLLTMAAMRASLTEVMTEAAYRHMIALATRLTDGLRAKIAARRLPWCVVQLGARVELVFRAAPPANGAEAREGLDPLLERALHLFLLNRGVLLTPFHNMMLVSPATSETDVNHLIEQMAAAFDALTAEADA